MALEAERRAPKLLGLVAIGVLLALAAAPAMGQSPAPSAPSSSSSPDLIGEGSVLFTASCASCHGAGGEGTENGPSLIDSGEAAADFQLRTGRMPLADPDAQAVRKAPAFNRDEIAALVAYVGSLGDGPQIPGAVDLERADVSSGQELFVQNCAPCHGATGNGGAAGRDALAPSLYGAETLDVAEAMITGPGEMPVFGFTGEEQRDIAGFIDYLQNEDPPGGADIGGIGPVPEGFVGWTVGMGALAVVCYLLGRKRSTPTPFSSTEPTKSDAFVDEKAE